MKSELTYYLKQHLAERSAEILLIERLLACSAYDEERVFFEELERRAKVDMEALQSLLSGFHSGPAGTRCMTKKLQMRLWLWRLNMDGTGLGERGKYLAMESLSLRLEGKRLMWTSLSKASEIYAIFSEFNFAQAHAEARWQQDELELFRMREMILVF